MSQFILVTLSYQPILYVAGIDQKKQWVTKHEIFVNESDARAFLKDKKKEGGVVSSRVEKLKESRIVRSRLFSGNQFMEVSIKAKGTIFNNFQERTVDLQVRVYTQGKIETMKIALNDFPA